MVEDGSVFHFDFNEVVYFPSTYVINEMIGIELEPHVTIESFSDYVSIHGVIELMGIYHKGEDGQVDMDDNSPSRVYVEKTEELSGEKASFYHQFPLDITIPMQRVPHVSDVSVNIFDFDYEVLQVDALSIKAVVEISGLNDEQEQGKDLALEEGTYSFTQIDELAELDNENEAVHYVESNNEADIGNMLPQNLNDGDELLDEVFAIDESHSKGQHENSNEVSETFSTSSLHEYMENDLPVESDSDDINVNEDSTEGSDSKDIDQTVDDTKEDVQTEESLGHLNYLKDIFKDDDDHYTCVRVYIVQSSDTLNLVAERYDVSPHALIEYNHLETDMLYPHQLLWIPQHS